MGSEEKKRKKKKINNKNKLDFLEKKNNKNFYCPSPIHIKNNPIINFNQIIKNNNNIQLNQNKIQNINDNKNNNKIIDNATNAEMQVNQHTNNDLDFSQLLTLVINGKQNLTNTNSNYNTNINNANNINNNQQKQEKDNSQKFVSNFFDNKQKTNNDDDNNTMIIHESEKLLPSTLKNIFDENKEEKIKEEMKISKQKEAKRKIFNFGKQAAKLFKNHKIVLIEKNKDDSTEIRIKNNLSSKSINKDDIQNIKTNFIQLNQNKALLVKIPEFNSDEEYSIHHFSNSDLIHEEVISFTFESIYQNINAYTNLEYSKNKKYQQKTLFYLTKLMSNKSKILSSFSEDDISSELNKSNSFSKKSKNSLTFKDKRNTNSTFKISFANRIQFNDLFNSPTNSKDYNNIYNSEVAYKVKKHRNRNNKKKTNHNIRLSRIYTDLYNNNIGLGLIKSKRSINLYSVKSKSPKRKKFKKSEIKYSFQNDTNDGDNICEINSNNNSKKKIRKKISLATEDLKKNKNKNDESLLNSEDMSNKKIKNSKTTKTTKNSRKKSHCENRLNIKEKPFKRKSGQPNRYNGKLKLEKIDEFQDNKGGIRNSLAYFAKEEKEECIII